MLAVLLASVTACSLGGCAGKKKDTVQTVKIGLTLYDQYDTFISELVSWFNASASALEEETGTAINVEVVDAAGSQTTQNEQVKSLIEKGCGAKRCGGGFFRKGRLKVTIQQPLFL